MPRGTKYPVPVAIKEAQQTSLDFYGFFTSNVRFCQMNT